MTETQSLESCYAYMTLKNLIDQGFSKKKGSILDKFDLFFNIINVKLGDGDLVQLMPPPLKILPEIIRSEIKCV
jgi:hypothetical protein